MALGRGLRLRRARRACRGRARSNPLAPVPRRRGATPRAGGHCHKRARARTKLQPGRAWVAASRESMAPAASISARAASWPGVHAAAPPPPPSVQKANERGKSQVQSRRGAASSNSRSAQARARGIGRLGRGHAERPERAALAVVRARLLQPGAVRGHEVAKAPRRRIPGIARRSPRRHGSNDRVWLREDRGGDASESTPGRCRPRNSRDRDPGTE